MSKTVISKAKELIQEQGKSCAIQYFQEKIDKMGEPKDFAQLCQQSGWETAINFIENYEEKE